MPTASQLREFGTERVMVYLNWCTFFAMYPGIGHGLDQDPDPYREYYRKYMPVIRSLGTAGWEPVTHAATDNPDLRVERYGYWSQGTLAFAVRNFSDEEAAGHLSIDSAALHIGDRTFVRDAFSSAELRWKKAAGQMVIPIRLQPAHTAVIRLGPR